MALSPPSSSGSSGIIQGLANSPASSRSFQRRAPLTPGGNLSSPLRRGASGAAAGATSAAGGAADLTGVISLLKEPQRSGEFSGTMPGGRRAVGSLAERLDLAAGGSCSRAGGEHVAGSNFDQAAAGPLTVNEARGCKGSADGRLLKPSPSGASAACSGPPQAAAHEKNYFAFAAEQPDASSQGEGLAPHNSSGVVSAPSEGGGEYLSSSSAGGTDSKVGMTSLVHLWKRVKPIPSVPRRLLCVFLIVGLFLAVALRELMAFAAHVTYDTLQVAAAKKPGSSSRKSVSAAAAAGDAVSRCTAKEQ